MRIMALDVGDKNIGVAVSDALGQTAHGRPTLRRQSWEQDLRQLRAMIQENEVCRIVVGQPLHMSGAEGTQSQKMARFARKLERALALPVVLWDERLTSFAAEQHLEEMGLGWRERRKHVDRVAAVILLQNYLDQQRSETQVTAGEGLNT